MTRPDPDWLSSECVAGYCDGFDLDNPWPGENRSAAYRHGFRNGRDDAECGAGLRQFPRLTAEQSRVRWRMIEMGMTP